jgi:arylesterase/paraoxonase
MRGLRILLIILAVGLLGFLLWNIVPASGVFARLEPRLVKECARVEVFPGTEDVTIDPALNLAFISASDRRAAAAGKPVQGGIFAMSLEEGNAVRRVTDDRFGDFQPHGISLWKGRDGGKRLFAINHATSGVDKMEIFDVGADGSLAHVKTIDFPPGSTPNDVLAVGPEAFYATYDHGFKTGIMNALENYLALPFSSVVYFDGANWSKPIEGLRFANGINMSADGKSVYVSEFFGRRIGVYARDAASGALTSVKYVKVNFGPDNIEVSQDGGLWIAGHDRVFAFLGHAKDPKAVSPSRVIRLNAQTDVYSNLFVDNTGALNASSVGAVWDKTLIVGAVFDGHVMVCPLLEIFFRTAPQYEQPTAKG